MMSGEQDRIREYLSSPTLHRHGEFSMEVSTDAEDDDYGFKSLPEYALKQIFLDPEKDFNRPKGGSVKLSESRRNIPTIVTTITPDSPDQVKKKRRAPQPPGNALGLAGARNKFPSSDDIVQQYLRVGKVGAKTGYSNYARPKSLSPSRYQADLWDELIVKLNSQSHSPSNSPRMSRTKHLLNKLRSPRTTHRGQKKRGLTQKEEEEAGFRTPSNNSSFDDTDGGILREEPIMFFGLVSSELERDTEFEVQRIPEYERYLNELLQETDPSHPDYDHLKRAATKVRQMVKEKEDELENMDNQKRMERVQDKFPYDDLQLRNLDLQRRQLASRRKSAPGAVLFKTLGKSKSANNLQTPTIMGKKEGEIFRPRQYNNFTRQYLMEGNVDFLRGMQKQERYLFLFSDLLLVAKQKSNTTFKLKHRIRVCELWIADCCDDIAEVSSLPKEKSFVIGWPTTNYVAVFKSVELKDTWLMKFKEQIQEERSKLVPKSLPLDVHYKDKDKVCHVEVETDTEVHMIVKHCLHQLAISEKDQSDYQLWVHLSAEESPYPLCGHELPYAIKLNHIREFGKHTDDNVTQLEIQRIMNEMQANNKKYEFFLKTKKSQKRHSLDENSTNTKMKNKRRFTIFRKNKDDKKAQGKVFGRPLTDVTTEESPIVKPMKDLLTILFREGPYTVGILRKSCNARQCKELRQKLDDGEDCLSGETWPPLVIGALVKDYLRNIPKSLLMESLFDDWVSANGLTDLEEKNNKVKDTLGKLPKCHYELLQHLICVLYHIDKKSDENKMTAYNLSVCIAPSMLWPKGNNDPLSTPPAIIQYMIENCPDVFGEDSVKLFGDAVEQKMRQDSSTDSDSMHSVLSSHGNFRRDDSSIDSLDREFYQAEMDSSPSMNKYHFSPSNLSGDSGLISDSQYYDEDGNGNDITNDPRNYAPSNSHFMERNMSQEEFDEQSRSLDGQFYLQYNHNNPVPPPRRTRRKGSDPSSSPNMEYDRKRMSYNPQSMYTSAYDKKYNRGAEKYKRSTESLKSVEESSEADSEMNMKNFKRQDIGTLIKSASGSHLFLEINSPTIYEFPNMNRLNNSRAHLYKQSSEGTMPMSPKYSLCSSHDSVLSDSSGSYFNRQNSPDPLSSPANTPDQEDTGMPQWLSQQSKHAAFTSAKQSRISHDDSEVGVKVDSKKPNKLNYLVSPKTSPKIRRRSPIPLDARRSFPLQPQLSQKGSGSNTSKEAEDIIKSPKLTITYCSQDSLDKRGFESEQASKPYPHLDIYNNNSQTAMRQLNIYSSGLQGTSPPPRVVLQGLSSQIQQKRENSPMKANHALFPQQRRNSFDSAEFIEHKQKYPMEECSVSSEDEGSDSEGESYTQVQSCFEAPWKLNLPTQNVIEHHKSASESSSISDDTANLHRPENPPNYNEAIVRNRLLKQGLSPDSGSDVDTETVKQREVSMHAKQLFEQSQKLYQNQTERYEQTLKASKEIISEEETASITSSSDDELEQPTNMARKLYEQSLKLYQEEQKSRSPLKKSSSEDKDNVSLSRSKGGQPGYSLLPPSASVQRSCSDVADLKVHHSRSSSGSSRTSSNDSTPTRRPTQPPPYNNPPPYNLETRAAESSPSDAKRHLFPRAGENVLTQNTNKTVATTSVSKSVGASPLNNEMSNFSISPRRDILISNRNRHPLLNQQVDGPVRDNTVRSSSTDYTVQSAQVDLTQYKVNFGRNRDSSLDSKLSPGVTNVRQPDSVLRARASSVDPQQSQSKQSQSDRNPNSVSKSQQYTNNSSSTVNRGQKELPWSVKHLSNIFDTSKNGSVSARSSPVVGQTQSGGPPAYTPPPSFQRATDTVRSSTSSNSSSNSGVGRTPGKPTYSKFGPQARDSFSSTDESDYSCRYSLSCRRDNSSLEELTDTSITDITYV